MSILQLGGEELYRDNERPARAPSAITIAADLNRYREIEVFGCTDEWIRCSCRLFKPSNAGTVYVWDQCHFALLAQNISDGQVWQRWTNWTISQSASGVKFTPISARETDFGDSGCSTYGAVENVGVQIVRISGWA